MPVNVEPTNEFPVPPIARAKEASTHSNNLRAKANTAMLLRELGADFETTPEEDEQAKQLMAQVDGEDPSKEVKKAQNQVVSTPGIALALGGYISHYDQQVIADKIQLRNIAINRLLEMSQDDDQKIAIKAVELIGKASDLFTEHQEITITHKNSAELQDAIREKIRLLMQMNTIDAETTSERLTKSLEEPQVVEVREIDEEQ
jgi:LAS superfamily LD-carboxypeptidase LdcB